jgi:hypothetical protein
MLRRFKMLTLGIGLALFDREFLHTVFGLASLSAIAVGLWWERPSLALIIIGGLLLMGIIHARRSA